MSSYINDLSNLITRSRCCPVCRRFDADGAHCFLKWKRIRHCWRDLQLEDVRESLLNTHSGEEFVRNILDLKADRCTIIVLMLWKWWDVRNKINAGEASPSNEEVISTVLAMFRDIENGDSQRSTSVAAPRRVWKPPEQDHLKINVDGAYKENNIGACGFIIRNHFGEAVLAGAANISPVMDALSAETVACLFALQAAE